MQNRFTRKFLLSTLCIMLAAALALFGAGCGNSSASSAASASEAVSAVSSVEAPASAETEAPAEAAPAAETGDVTVLGEGATVFTFTVIDADANESDYEIHTDETTVGAALLALDLVAGEDSEYGLYVTTVNGITLDYDTDGSYWAFYINDEYASTGVDATDIEAGAVYSLRAEKG